MHSSLSHRLLACAPLAALAIASAPAAASPTPTEQQLLTQYTADGSSSVLDCGAQPAAPGCAITDGWAYDVTGPRGGQEAPEGRQLLGSFAAANGLTGVSKASVLLSSPGERRAGDPKPLAGTEADLAARFFDTIEPTGSYVNAVYARHGSRPAPGEPTGKRLQIAGSVSEKRALLGPDSAPLRERSSITEHAAQCENATGNCEPADIDDARRLSADPQTGAPGTTHVYSVSVLKIADGQVASRAATDSTQAATGTYVRGAYDTRLRQIPATLTCAQARAGVAFGVRFAASNRKRISGNVRLLADEGTAQFNSQPFRGSDGATFSYRARANDRICGRTIRATYSLRLRDDNGRFTKRQIKTYRINIDAA